MNTKNEQQKEAAGIIARMLAAFGVPGNWAKIIAGAIMGAVLTWMGMTQTSCAPLGSANPPGHVGLTITEGQVVVTRDSHGLTWDRATNSLVWTQVQPETGCLSIVQREK